MSRKLDFVPFIKDYSWIRNQMDEDLKYRLSNRLTKTSLGRPLYERINVQLILTRECPYRCPFCVERQNPMMGKNDFDKQITSLLGVLNEHPNARLTITGGEPCLYIEHVRNIVNLYKNNSNGVFVSVNTTGCDERIYDIEGVKINLSVNDFVNNTDKVRFSDRICYQTILDNNRMNKDNIISIMTDNDKFDNFSFRFLSNCDTDTDYSVNIWNDIQSDDRFKIGNFRIGDFFTYLTFDYGTKHGRITLGDMFHQIHNDYKDGYSNIIIHPNGEVKTNWK